MNIFILSLIAGMVLLSITLILILYRFLKGPRLSDRVTAFDLLAANFIGMTCIFAVLTDNKALMDVAIVISLIAFLGATGFAYYLRKRRELIREREEKGESPGNPG